MGASPYFIVAGAYGYGLKCNMMFVLRDSPLVAVNISVERAAIK